MHCALPRSENASDAEVWGLLHVHCDALIVKIQASADFWCGCGLQKQLIWVLSVLKRTDATLRWEYPAQPIQMTFPRRPFWASFVQVVQRHNNCWQRPLGSVRPYGSLQMKVTRVHGGSEWNLRVFHVNGRLPEYWDSNKTLHYDPCGVHYGVRSYKALSALSYGCKWSPMPRQLQQRSNPRSQRWFVQLF